MSSNNQKPYQEQVWLFTKLDTWSERAIELTHKILDKADIHVFQGRVGEQLPELPPGESVTILSFLSPWILSQAVLNRASLALNFHPGSCDYPGIGCYNFALYDNAKNYGAVCHHMKAKVDTGAIVQEALFKVAVDESVYSLKERTMAVMLEMFKDILDCLTQDAPLPVSERQWQRRPFRRTELNALGQITSDMSDEEIHRRVRAMSFPGFPGAFIDLGGYRFHVEAEKNLNRLPEKVLH